MLQAVIGVVLGALLFVASAEVAFRVLPVASATMSGYYVDPRILTYPPMHEWRVSTGWDLRNPQALRANNFGWASDHDFVPNSRAIALVGDSYVEASMLPARSRPAAQLERELGGGRPVYAFGGPGSSLLDYAERIRFAVKRLGVKDFVVLVEPGDARQSLCGSGNVHGPCLDRMTLQPRVELQPTASRAKQLLRHSALAQYVYAQLKVDAALLWKRAFTRSVPQQSDSEAPAQLSLPTGEFTSASTNAVVDAFLAHLDELGGDIRVLFVVDGRRSKLTQMEPTLANERRRLIERLRAAGKIVVDAEPLYAAHEAVSPLALSVGPYDGHLNALGVAIVTKAMAAELR